MSEIKVSYMNYPIYGLASNGNYIVTSGGGGGKNYGIEDLLDINILNEKEQKLQVIWSTTEQNGIIDCIEYIDKYNIWIGSLKNKCILFEINEEKGPNILLTFLTDFSEKNPRQVVVKFSNNDNLILTGGDDKTLRLWKLKFCNDNNKICLNMYINENEKKKVYLDPENGIEHLGDYIGHDESIKDCDITSDNKIICTCSGDFSLKLWNTFGFTNLHSEFMKNPKNKNDKLIFRSCKFAKKIIGAKNDIFYYKLLTTASSVKGHSYFIIWLIKYNENKNSLILTKANILGLDEKPCCNMKISLSGKYFVFGFSTGNLKIYNNKLNLLAHYKKHELPITSICFTKNEEYLLTAGADYSIACINMNVFKFSYLKKIYNFFIFVFIFLIFLIILLDFFNFGYDIYFQDTIQNSIKNKIKIDNIKDTIHQKIQTMDEL